MDRTDPFLAAADRVLRYMHDHLSAAGLNSDLSSDVLAWRWPDGTKATLIRQGAVRQIWFADGVAAWYCDWCPEQSNWFDGRGRGPLGSLLEAAWRRRVSVQSPAAGGFL